MTRLLTFAAAGALLPGAVFAQSLPDNDDITITAARAAQPMQQVGQSISVIDAATLARQQTVVLADALAQVPGVTVTRNGGLGGVTSLFIRGASSEHTLVVIDGVAVNDPTSPGGSFDFSALLAGTIARVEVLRGANSVPWGSAALGGVVNISTAAPSRRLAIAANAEGGSYGTSLVNASVTDTIGAAGVALGGGWLHTSGISAYAKGSEPDGFDTHYLNGRTVITLSREFTLDVQGHYARSLTNIDGFNTPSFSFGDDAEYQTQTEWSGSISLRGRFAGGRYTDRTTYAAYGIARDTGDASQTPPYEFGYQGHIERLEYHGDWRAARFARLVFGFVHEQSSLVIQPDAYGDPASFPRTHIDSAYADVLLTPTPTLSLSAGARLDRHAAYGDHVTTSASGAWHIRKATTVRASYAEGFKAPTLYQLYAPYLGTATLRPETSRGFDVGVEQSALGGAVRATATYFRRVSRDLIDYDPVSFSYFNITRTRAQGEEVSVIVTPTAGLVGTLAYTHLTSLNEQTGLQLARRPDNRLSLSLDAAAGPVKLGATVQLTSSSFNDAANTDRLDGYVLVGVRAAVPLSRQLELYGRIDNLLDERYQVVRNYGTLGRAAYVGVRIKA